MDSLDPNPKLITICLNSLSNICWEKRIRGRKTSDDIGDFIAKISTAAGTSSLLKHYDWERIYIRTDVEIDEFGHTEEAVLKIMGERYETLDEAEKRVISELRRRKRDWDKYKREQAYWQSDVGRALRNRFEEEL